MNEERKQRLLRELADGFEHGEDLLLSTEWLVQNEVTAGENQALSNQLALVLHGWLVLPRDLQNAVLIAGAAGSTLPEAQATPLARNAIINAVRQLLLAELAGKKTT